MLLLPSSALGDAAASAAGGGGGGVQGSGLGVDAVPSTVSLLPVPAVSLHDLAVFNVPLLQQLSVDVNFAIAPVHLVAGAHNHLKLSIEVKDDGTYVVLVESWERSLDECAQEKVKKKSAVDEANRTIAVEICARNVRKLVKELKFCLAALQLCASFFVPIVPNVRGKFSRGVRCECVGEKEEEEEEREEGGGHFFESV